MSGQSKNLFYDLEYLKIQAHKEIRIFKDERFRVIFSINDGVAISLPRGLFGSFEQLSGGTQSQFSVFLNETIDELRSESVHRIEIISPSGIYEGFVLSDWLIQEGFSEEYADINHHLVLSDFQMHKMEIRKLEKLDQLGLVVKELSKDHLQEVLDFLTNCRKEMGLELNISYEKLATLFQAFPERYSIFGAYMNDQLVSSVITVQTAADVVYYYLPGTLEKYKKESPMVRLIQFLVDHFKTKVKYIDLGVSSMEGKPQEGLIAFKERMGGIKSLKKKFEINL